MASILTIWIDANLNFKSKYSVNKFSSEIPSVRFSKVWSKIIFKQSEYFNGAYLFKVCLSKKKTLQIYFKMEFSLFRYISNNFFLLFPPPIKMLHKWKDDILDKQSQREYKIAQKVKTFIFLNFLLFIFTLSKVYLINVSIWRKKLVSVYLLRKPIKSEDFWSRISFIKNSLRLQSSKSVSKLSLQSILFF